MPPPKLRSTASVGLPYLRGLQVQPAPEPHLARTNLCTLSPLNTSPV